jgi:flavin-dependent dehydrogenase
MRIAAGSRRASLQLPGSFAVSREALDAALVSAAIESGAEFLPLTVASLGPCCRDRRKLARQGGHAPAGSGRVVHLRRTADRAAVTGQVVVAASGLGGGTFLPESNGESEQPLAAARIGAATTTSSGVAFYGSGMLYMAIAAGGYVGLVRLEDGRLNIAAAFERGFLSAAGGAGQAAAAVLANADLPLVDGIETLAWKGTPPLTSRPAARSLERVFVIGDAAGYVEPFTGEGIAWALTGALAVAPFVEAAASRWDAALMTQWERCYDHVVARSQRTCGLLARLLRHPLVVRSTIALLGQVPAAASPLVRHVVGVPHSPTSSYRQQEYAP